MLAQVIKENMEISIAMITVIFDQHETPAGYAKGIASILREVMKNDPDFFHLFFEGFAVARQSQVVNQQLANLYGKFRLALENCLNQAQEKKIIKPELPIKALAAIITGLIDGMGLQFLTEPALANNDLIWESIETSIVDLLG